MTNSFCVDYWTVSLVWQLQYFRIAQSGSPVYSASSFSVLFDVILHAARYCVGLVHAHTLGHGWIVLLQKPVSWAAVCLQEKQKLFWSEKCAGDKPWAPNGHGLCKWLAMTLLKSRHSVSLWHTCTYIDAYTRLWTHSCTRTQRRKNREVPKVPVLEELPVSVFVCALRCGCVHVPRLLQTVTKLYVSSAAYIQ